MHRLKPPGLSQELTHSMSLESALLVASSHGQHYPEAHCLHQPTGATPCPCLRPEAGNGCACVAPHPFFAKVRSRESHPRHLSLTVSPKSHHNSHSSYLSPSTLPPRAPCSSATFVFCFAGWHQLAYKENCLGSVQEGQLCRWVPSLALLRLLSLCLCLTPESLLFLPVSSWKSYHQDSLYSHGAHY